MTKFVTLVNGVQVLVEEAGGAGGGSAVIYVVTVDFGNGAYEKTFNLPLAGALTSQKVIATPSLNMPAGVAEDELEMDMLACAGKVISNDNIQLTIASLRGRINGQRNINISLG